MLKFSELSVLESSLAQGGNSSALQLNSRYRAVIHAGMKQQAGHAVKPTAIYLCCESHELLYEQPKASLASSSMNKVLAFEHELCILTSPVRQK